MADTIEKVYCTGDGGDLDGAKSKHIVNDAVLKAITTETSLVVDFGGGICFIRNTNNICSVRKKLQILCKFLNGSQINTATLSSLKLLTKFLTGLPPQPSPKRLYRYLKKPCPQA